MRQQYRDTTSHVVTRTCPALSQHVHVVLKHQPMFVLRVCIVSLQTAISQGCSSTGFSAAQDFGMSHATQDKFEVQL